MSKNKNDWWSGNKSILYGVLGCFFVFALLIHWNHNYRNHSSSNVEVINDSELQAIGRVVKDYFAIHERIQNGTDPGLMLGELKHFETDTSYQKWPQQGMPVLLQAAVVRLSRAQTHMNVVKECATEQIRLIDQNKVVPEDLKNKTGIELANALEEALGASKIIIEYKEKNR